MPRKSQISDESAVLDYTNRILTRIENYMIKNNLSQKEFADSCGISQSTLSKVLSGKSVLTLPMIYRISAEMHADPAQIVSGYDSIYDNLNTFEERMRAGRPDYSSESLVFDPHRMPFRGMLGKYNFYCKPTISSESGFLKGTLELAHSNTTNNYCTAKLELYTGRVNAQRQPIVKTYTGQTVISLPMSSCYIILCSKDYADYCVLNWHHIFLNDRKLECRFAACLTTSAGANRRPVMLKCLISREPLDDNDLSVLSGQFNMNSSSIHISKSKYDEFILPALSEEEKRSLESIRIENDSYNLPEGSLRGLEIPSKRKHELINLLRKYSTSDSYTKISTKCDEILFAYIEQKMQKRYMENQESPDL